MHITKGKTAIWMYQNPRATTLQRLCYALAFSLAHGWPMSQSLYKSARWISWISMLSCRFFGFTPLCFVHVPKKQLKRFFHKSDTIFKRTRTSIKQPLKIIKIEAWSRPGGSWGRLGAHLRPRTTQSGQKHRKVTWRTPPQPRWQPKLENELPRIHLLRFFVNVFSRNWSFIDGRWSQAPKFMFVAVLGNLQVL